MPFVKLQFRPGIVRDVTSYTNEGGWRDGDKIRFRNGFPEMIGGWQRYSNNTFLGTCRALLPWSDLDNTPYMGVGTNLKYYVERGGGYYDVTPIRATTAAGDVTFSATSGSSTVTVSDTSHGALENDFVTFSGAVSLGGTVTADVLNGEHQIISIVDSDSYTIELSGVVANGSDTGNGGASVVGAYQINSGLATAAVGSGWGADRWGFGGWGDPATLSVVGAQLRTWSHDNYGEDLIFNPTNGGIYYWDTSGLLTDRAVAISDLSGANKAPTVARQVMVSTRDRHTIAFGCDGEFDVGNQDLTLIRFSAQEDITDWETRADNTAGSLRLSSGSQILAAIKTKQQILIFTDVSLHAMQYIGPPFTFGITEVSTNTSLAGFNSAVAVNDTVYWMGKGEFYSYNGRVQQIPCPVRDYVFNDLNPYQSNKIVAGHNTAFSEIWWHYPSADSDENDRYVIYNYAQNIWYFGTMVRTAWVAKGEIGNPIAASTDGRLYNHETGLNDGSSNPEVAIPSYIESSPVEIAEGDQYMFASRVLPDLSFRNSTGDPSATLTLKMLDYPGGGYSGEEDDGVITRSAELPVEKYTKQLFVRLRGRAAALRLESDQYNTTWRLGSPRVDVRTDGRR